MRFAAGVGVVGVVCVVLAAVTVRDPTLSKSSLSKSVCEKNCIVGCRTSSEVSARCLMSCRGIFPPTGALACIVREWTMFFQAKRAMESEFSSLHQARQN